MKVRRGLRWLGVAVAAAIAYLAIRSLVSAWHEAARQPVEWAPNPWWIAAAIAVALLTYAILIESWRRTLLAYGETASFPAAVRLWILSNFGKYFGSFGIVAGMAVLAQGTTITPGGAVTAAVLMQALSLVTGVALSGLLAAGALRDLGPLYSWGAVAVGLLALAGSALLHSQRALDRLRALVPGQLPWLRAANARSLLIGLVGNGVAWAGYGVVMTLLARGLFASAPPRLGDATAAYAVSYLVGLLALFVPAGLGLREAIFTALLAPVAGVKVAAALAVASRILLTLVEFSIALPFVVLRRRPGPSTSDPGR